MKTNRLKSALCIPALCLIVVFLCACSQENYGAASTPTPVPPTPSATATPTAALPVPTTVPVVTPVPTITPTPSPEYIGQIVCTADEFVNIRSGAGTQTDIIGTLPGGETADVIAFEDDWVHVSYNGITGYVSRSYTVSKHTPGIAVPMGDWAMRLVNPESALPEDFTVELADFEGGQVDARIFEICTAMFADAAQDGITLQLVDAYRSRATQSEQFEETVSRYTSQGDSRTDAETKAATITARPDTSEHQTGLALDIVTPSYTKRSKGFAKTDAFKWLNANAASYGFTMRYKADKVSITGVIYEPWHWRFVGTEAAEAMQQSGQCLEEYLDTLN